MKNLRKLETKELKTIKGGVIPRDCMSWDPRVRCCRQWLPESSDKPICPDSPF